MILSNRNQLANVKNSFQGPAKRVLCVCSAGLLRSPTIATVLEQHYGYNTRACGVSDEYALIPISTALIAWADLIVFADMEHMDEVHESIPEGKETLVLGLRDCYDRMEEALVTQILTKFNIYMVGQ